ncbi:hypothetical protein PtrSN002B_011559, partial [Pyrenophora tritici-repentis]
MLEHPHNIPADTRHRQHSLPRKQLRICWANVSRSSPWHIKILETAFQKGIDVVCIQEPFTYANSRTSTHPGFTHLAPISTWDSPNTPGCARPRVMTYIRKGGHLRYQASESLNHPDMLWAVVSGVAILNCYRQPHTPHVIQYVTHLIPPQLCLVGGDFNARHESFEPTTTAANGGIELASWAANASMDYIGVPGQPTHCAGHVLDLTFSNIPFAQSAVDASMHSGSDHETIVTSVPITTPGTPHLEQYHYRVPEASLPKFAGLVEMGVQNIPNPLATQDAAQLDECDDKDLFKIIAWHKLTPENQDTPLIVNNTTIFDPLEKAEALREEVFNRFTAEDDLSRYPNQESVDTLPWSTHVSLEE